MHISETSCEEGEWTKEELILSCFVSVVADAQPCHLSNLSERFIYSFTEMDHISLANLALQCATYEF